MQGHLPPAAQEKYQEMQRLQDEAEQLVAEKSEAESDRSAAREALAALEGVEDGEELYRSIGRVRVRTEPAPARKRLEASIEQLDERIEELDGRKADLEERFERRKEDIKHLLGGASGDPTSPGTTE